MKAIIRKEIHLTVPMAKALEKEAKNINSNLKKHIETILKVHLESKKEENGKGK